MKYFRYATLIASAAALIGVAYGTASQLIQFAGLIGSVKLVCESPSFLLLGFYETLGQLGLNIEFWAWNGPLVALALIATLLVASLPR